MNPPDDDKLKNDLFGNDNSEQADSENVANSDEFDDQFVERLRDIDIPMDLKKHLHLLPSVAETKAFSQQPDKTNGDHKVSLLNEKPSQGNRPSDTRIQLLVLSIATSLLVLVFSIITFIGKRVGDHDVAKQDGSSAMDKNESVNNGVSKNNSAIQNQTPNQGTRANDLRVADLDRQLASTFELLESELRSLERERLQDKLSRYQADSAPVSSDEKESVILAVAADTEASFGRDPQKVAETMKHVTTMYPRTMGAEIATQFLDNLQTH